MSRKKSNTYVNCSSFTADGMVVTGWQKLFTSEPNAVYVGDITYLPTTYDHWPYLNVWIDLFSRSVVGSKVDIHMEKSLVVDSLSQAVHKRRPGKGLIIHSDRGGLV